MKKVVLDIHERQEEEDYQGLIVVVIRFISCFMRQALNFDDIVLRAFDKPLMNSVQSQPN